MTTALHIFNLVLPYLAAGGAITVLTQVLKRIAKLEKEGVIRLVFHTVTVLMMAATYLLGNHGLSYGLVLLHGAGFSGIANALYPLVRWADDKLVKIQKALQLVDKDLPAIQKAVDEMESAAGTATSDTAPMATSQAAAQNSSTPPPANF